MSSPINRHTRKSIAKIARGAGKELANKIDPMIALRQWCEYKKAEIGEQTKREEIRARRDTAVAAIQAQKELIETYFEKRFAERRQALSGFLELLTHAVDTKNDKELDAALGGILGIVQDSPLKDFEAFRQARLEGGSIEI